MKVEKNDSTSEEFSLDAILARLGRFGKFQLYIFTLISIPITFSAVSSVSYVFTTSTVTQRCRVPECDVPASIYKEPWVEYSIPKTPTGIPSSCYRYEAQNTSDNQQFCYAENFDRQKTETCGKDFIFANEEVTISNEFEIYCSDQWKLSTLGSFNNVGQLFGFPLGGFIADKYGRRTALAVGGFLCALTGVIRSFSVNYTMFLMCEVIDNLFGATLFATAFIYAAEYVGPTQRVLVGSVTAIFWAFGETLLGLTAKYTLNWRTTLRVLYIPGLVHILLYWFLPESIRWLLSQGNEEKATKTLKTIAATNKGELSEETIAKLMLNNRKTQSECGNKKLPLKSTIKTLVWRILNCSFCWFTHCLVYYGLSLNSVTIGGNKYDNFIYISLVEIPGFFISYLTIDSIGRRYSLFGYLFICGICVGATAFVRPDFYVMRLVLFLLGKLVITASFQVLYFFTAEIYPTNVRNTLLSLCSMLGRFGSIAAPYTPLMSKLHESAPAILFAVFAITSSLLTLLLPETKNTVLPTTTNEAQNIGENKKDTKTEAQSTIC